MKVTVVVTKEERIDVPDRLIMRTLYRGFDEHSCKEGTNWYDELLTFLSDGLGLNDKEDIEYIETDDLTDDKGFSAVLFEK